MATLLLSAAGAALGGAVPGSVLGLSGAVIGRAVGATLGRVIDQRLLGTGSEPVETGKIDRYRLSGVGEGTPVAKMHGRMRLGGQVIWSTHFKETATTTGGGKGAPAQPKTTSYAYSVSLALALCEGEILSLGRIWADGTLVDRATLTLRLYRGTDDQMPDPRMEAVEGAGTVPAYRGMAYVVIEDLDLSPYGNRVPQFSFEVVRAAKADPGLTLPAGAALRGVALIPGTGEYALATTPVTFRGGIGGGRRVNVATSGGATDFAVSLEALTAELPNARAVSLVVSWFGDDLRAGHCRVRPKVEQAEEDGAEMPWSVSGLTRGTAEVIARQDDRPVYGGTPADAAVLEAIAALHAAGREVMIYPFLLMEILPGNSLPGLDGDTGQPAFPWRGRIGTGPEIDGTAAARAAVEAFFGTVRASDFTVSPGAVSYHGPEEWSLSRFILHLAALGAAAGGIGAFCVGSELRGITRIRDEAGFPGVDALRALTAEVRALLPGAKLGYAADWSEYFGYQPQDGSGDVFYNLDPLWADSQIDFVGIDNYMPLADWRDGDAHADVGWGSSHNLDYLRANIEGGEGFDWYYPSAEARAAQIREPITDGEGGSPWVYRYKDIRAWWSNLHVERRHPLDRSILAGGADPAGWSVAGGTAMPEADAQDRFTAPVRVASGGDAGDGIATGAVLAADLSFELRVTLRFGSSGLLRVALAAPGGTVTLTCAAGGTPVASGSGLDIQHRALEDAGGGVWILRVILRGGPGGALTLTVGPGSASAGADLVVFGADLTQWPVPPSPWIPRSKPVWFTEFGCPAIDKGANQPNVFVDPKSSESAVPYHSTGRRDDVIQAQALRAITSYWADPEVNPVSELYGGPMIDLDHSFAWAWDARPFPAFPTDTDRWSDGANFPTGHWISGRISGQSLDLVVAEICRDAGLDAVDTSGLRGVVRGHVTAEVDSARARLQPLMLAYDFTAVEREGRVVFAHLPLVAEAEIGADDVAIDDDLSDFSFTRAPQAETVGRARVGYTEADGAFETRVAEAIFPDDADITTSQSELPLSLTASEARDIATRWLAAARVARETVEVALPPSRRDVAAGSLVALPGGTLWRVDRVENRVARRIEATRVEPTLSRPAAGAETLAPPEAYVAPVAVDAVFLDLPLLTGEEVPHAPHVAVAAEPWPGSVAVYAAPTDANYTLDTLVETASAIGTLESPLPSATPGRWDRGPAVRVRMAGHALASVTPGEVLAGANVAAVAADAGGPWEVLQFAEATLVGPDLWEISMRLRGQAGTDADMGAGWPAGALFVLLDGRPRQISLPMAARGLARHYRIGPARRSLDDASYTGLVRAFDGIGLRPLSPVHLRFMSAASGARFTWIRRSRIDGDSWVGTDVPIGEDAEAYLLRVRDAGGLRREVTVVSPDWTYPEADRIADGTAAQFTVEVAQVSARFGPGPFARIDAHV